MRNLPITAIVLAFACGPATLAAATDNVRFVYDDLDSFARAVAAIDAGSDVATEMQRYVDSGSPAFRFFLRSASGQRPNP
jgi:hypothetical protein